SVLDQERRLRAAILKRNGYSSEADVPRDERKNALADAAALAPLNAHWGIVSNVPVGGRLIVLIKRVMRIGLRWYINPIVDQQNAFNDAAVRAMYALQAENDRLRAELQRLGRDGERP
ncbi:MAG TPA: hypothetical protein VHG52_06910, partial [Thermomicrobiales bacterium]|nr:hypothetical protein [Thermomicrobiales bacterium]